MKWEEVYNSCDEHMPPDNQEDIFDICGFSGLPCRPGNCCYIHNIQAELKPGDIDNWEKEGDSLT